MVRKLEQLGHRVGESLVERVSRDTPRFKNELDAVVFVCKHLWTSCFNKQIDNLRTNHQVIHVWLSHFNPITAESPGLFQELGRYKH